MQSALKQATIASPTRFEIVEVPSPTLQSAGDIVLRTSACGICSGDLMEWYLERKVGSVLGHEVVGVAESVGSEVAGIRTGQLVFAHHHAPCGGCRSCRAGDHVHCPTWRSSKLDPGGMAQRIRVPASIVRHDCFAIDGLAAEIGIFIEPLGCCVRAIEKLGAKPRGWGVVIGCGIMGLLNLRAARALGSSELWAVEPDPMRREWAIRSGANVALHPREFEERISATGFDGADFVIVGPGIPELVAGAARAVRNGGMVVLFAPTPPGAVTPLDFDALYFREITFAPSYSCGPAETRKAYELLREGAVHVADLITHRFPLSRVQEAYNVAKAGGSALKVLVEFQSE